MKKQDSEILEQRQEELAEKLDPTWLPQADTPILSVGNIHYEISDRTQAINYGGLGLAVLLVKSVGLAPRWDAKYPDREMVIGVIKEFGPAVSSLVWCEGSEPPHNALGGTAEPLEARWFQILGQVGFVGARQYLA